MPKCGNCKKCQKGKKEKCFDKECHTNCNSAVDVKVDVDPTVRHTEQVHRRTDFKIDLDFKTTPHCCIREQRHKKVSKCQHKCTFIVDVDLDIKAKSCVSKPCSPEATFDLKIDLDHDTHCKLAKGPHDCADRHD